MIVSIVRAHVKQNVFFNKENDLSYLWNESPVMVLRVSRFFTTGYLRDKKIKLPGIYSFIYCLLNSFIYCLKKLFFVLFTYKNTYIEYILT